MTKKERAFVREETASRLSALRDDEVAIIVTQAFGPTGESLMDDDPNGPRFSGERGVRVRVRQGDVDEIVVLSPFFGDPSKIAPADFEEGVRCDLLCPISGEPLDRIKGMETPEGGSYFAIYLTPDLEGGDLVAVNDIWGDTTSQLLDEANLLRVYAETGEMDASSRS